VVRHSLATYWAPKMNRYQLCAKCGWAFGSDMPDGYIKRKGIFFDEVAEKGDVDRTSRLQKENMKLTGKIETLEREENKMKQVLEFIIPLIEEMDSKEFKAKMFEKRKEQPGPI